MNKNEIHPRTLLQHREQLERQIEANYEKIKRLPPESLEVFDISKHTAMLAYMRDAVMEAERKEESWRLMAEKRQRIHLKVPAGKYKGWQTYFVLLPFGQPNWVAYRQLEILRAETNEKLLTLIKALNQENEHGN